MQDAWMAHVYNEGACKLWCLQAAGLDCASSGCGAKDDDRVGWSGLVLDDGDATTAQELVYALVPCQG